VKRKSNQEAEWLLTNQHLEPIGPNLIGPFRWNRRPAFEQFWRKFKPIVLSSEKGQHVIISPCSKEWYEEMKKAQVFFPLGYEVQFPDGRFVIESGFLPQPNEMNKELFRYGAIVLSKRKTRPSSRTIVMKKKESGCFVAKLDDTMRSIRFSDGSNFKIVIRNWMPLKRPAQFEFLDESGARQFHIDRKMNIWLEEKADMKHILSLITMGRYLMDLNNAEA
jgi:hypothetical protein